MTVASQRRGARRMTSMGYGDYLRFSKLVRDRYGLSFPEKRRTDLEMGVRQAFAASTCADLDEYYHLLENSNGAGVEMDRLVNALTVGETYFFRDAGQFDALYNQVLPQIINRRRALRTLRIWSAGCASGEEPYSIAMMLRDLLPDVDEWSITILGTDLNTEALDRARKAVYGDWSFREERARKCRPRFFQRRGKRYDLIPEVQRMVTFAQLNLAEDCYPAYRTNTTFMDLILCRNVTIYFAPSIVHEVTGRFYDALADGGWLVVGHSETSPITYRSFQARGFPKAVLYERTGRPTELPADWDWLLPTPRADKPIAPSTLTLMPVSPQPLGKPLTPQVKEEPGTPPAVTREPGLRAHPSEIKESDAFERAAELLDYGRSEEARDLLLELVESKPDHAAARALLGRACANLGAWSEAEDWCRQAVHLDKLALEAYYTLALVLQHQGRLDEAIDAMKKVVYIDRHHVLGHFGLAGLYRSNGRLPLALKSLDNARHLLVARADDELVTDSGGITAGRLRATVTRQQQQWGAETNGLEA
jgi:chemotaxis protein methyltransferase CheR